MSRTARLLEMIITLQTKSHFTVQQLADEFVVSRRTMLRDLHALSEMGVPLAATPGPHGGYSLIRRQRLLPLSLSPDEAIGVMLSYEAFLQYADSPFAAQSLSAITKLRNALPPDIVRELDRIRRHVVVMEAMRTAGAPLLSQVLQAALAEVHLDIVYDSSTGVSERRIFPVGLYASHGLWYCVAHDFRREAQLSLRVDRILSVEVIDGLDRPEVLSIRDWLETNRSDAVRWLRCRAKVNRRAAKNLELETLFGQVALDEQGEGVIDALIPASEIEYYAGRLLILGQDIQVESPKVLVEAIRDRARAVAGLYT
jgi:predicted DNA-binding transcriptional regulator YafY